MKKSTKPILVAIIALSVYVLFHTSLEAILTKALVTTVLSKAVITDNPIAIIGYLVIITCFGSWIGKRIAKGFRFSQAWLVWSIVLCGIYVYYRFYSNVWSFTPIWGNVKALDILMLLPIPFIISAFSSAPKKRDKDDQQQKKGFMRDDPITIKKESDPYERHRFMVEIKERILHTPRGESSFCIGVIGSWGSGKTTFLKTLKGELDHSKKVIQFEFNPWTKASNGSLTEAFFGEFSYQLGGHTDLLQGEVEKYVKILVGGNASSIFARAAQYLFPSVRWEQSSAETAKERISNALHNLRKKVVIYIDDIDRLDQSEVAEVFKLVRNSAGFSDVVYVIAFDRPQVEAALKKNFEQSNRTYLEKILQVEFYLPPPNFNLVFSNLVEGLEERLSKDESNFLHDLLIVDGEFHQPTLLWMKSFFHHQRDVVRFLNQFDFHYTFVKGEVFLPDFLALMILRFKYPEFTMHFYRDKFKYLTFKEEYQQALATEGELILEGVAQTSTHQSKMKLYKALEAGIPEAGIAEGDLGPFSILENVFEGPQPGGLPQWSVFRRGPKHHLSIKFSEYFSRYFDFSFSGRLSDVEFDQALYGSRDEFMNKIGEWCINKQLGNDLLTTLDRFTEYKDKDQFEKIICALVYMTNSKNDDHSYYVHPMTFLNRFELRSEDNTKRMLKIYSSRQEIGAFLLSELDGNMAVDSWSYDIAEELSKADDNEYPVDRKAAALMVAKACEAYFKSPNGIGTKFGTYAVDWENACSRAGLPSPNEMVRTIILSDLKVSMPLFIGYCPEHFDEGRYLIREDWVGAIFKEKSQFITEVTAADLDAGKELLDFEQELIKVKSEGRKCVPYQFKFLHVDEANTGRRIRN